MTTAAKSWQCLVGILTQRIDGIMAREECLMSATPEAEALLAYGIERLPTYLSELRHLCIIECPTSYKPGVDEAGDWVRTWAGIRGWAVRTWQDSEVGNSLVVTVPGGDPGGARVLLAAHLDTVYPVGIAAQRPVRQEGDVLLGPGTCDNKSGLVSGLYAMAALQDLDLLERFAVISIVCGGDEETDMCSSGALLMELAPEYDAGFVLEAGRENGDLVGSRKGSGHFTLTVHGKEAHAGVEPHKGANAILALAQQIVALLCRRPWARVCCLAGASTVRKGSAQTRCAQGSGTSTISEIQRNPRVVTLWRLVERTGSR